jgi:hypothetical protein
LEEPDGERVLDMLALGEDMNAVSSELGNVIEHLLLALIFAECTNHRVAPNALS